jgi:hypothetical protein
MRFVIYLRSLKPAVAENKASTAVRFTLIFANLTGSFHHDAVPRFPALVF